MYSHSSHPTYQPMLPPQNYPSHPPSLQVQTATPPQPHYPPYYTATSASSMGSRTAVPPSPSEQSERTGPDEDFSSLPGPPPTQRVWNGYIWSLEILQHPSRARMCGFGDKDRRPISPPPCIRLIILNADTKEEVEYANFNQFSLDYLVLTVDIWDYDAKGEVNLVKQSNASPCISSAATGAYPMSMRTMPSAVDRPSELDHRQLPSYSPAQMYAPPPPPPPPPQPPASYYPPSSHSYSGNQNPGGVPPPRFPPFQSGGVPPPGVPAQSPFHLGGNFAQQHQGYGGLTQAGSPYAKASSIGMPPVGQQMPPASDVARRAHQDGESSQPPLYTRNLIGSLCSSAFRLQDEHGKWGIWFVLHDLSVRTEGWFRLRLNFFNLTSGVDRQMQVNGNDEASQQSPEARSLGTTAPCLASVFSNPFKVFSAKKFPGVVESTALSKAFARQGIKIPIRKDTGNKRSRADSDEDDDDGE